MQMDISDRDITRTEDSPPWHPLETVLSTWISMIQTGKITVAPEDVKLDNEKYNPWLNHPYSHQQLEDTVATFDRLTTAIESRMLASSLSLPNSSPLLSHATLTSASVPLSCFTRSLLTTVRAPRFMFIAPGLLLPTASTFASTQRFTAVSNDDEDRLPVPPVLLFRATNHTFPLDPNDNDNNPFGFPYRDSLREALIPAGLYTNSTDRRDANIEEDGFRLLLPYIVGQHGFARRSDGRRFENRAELYQHGHQPFGGEWTRAQRLVRLLEKWLEMVEGGIWAVDESGVVGGVEMFREADIESAWESYWIEPSW